MAVGGGTILRSAVAAWLAVSIACVTNAARAESALVLPGQTFTDADRITQLNAALGRQDFAAAAATLDALLAEDGEKLMSGGKTDGALISVSAWIDALPRAQRVAVAAAYRERFEPTVGVKLEAMKTDARAAGIDALYGLARRYRFCPSGAAAYALAADRALDGGDLPTAAALYQLALRGGWQPDDARAQRIESLRRIDEGATVALPPDAPAGDAPPSSIPNAKSAKAAKPYAGPVPFDAAWMEKDAGAARVIPFAADERFYLCGPGGVLSLKESGQVAWTTVAPASGRAAPPPAQRRPPAPAAPPKGSPDAGYWSPAVLTDVYGRGQLVVARQAAPQSAEPDERFELRAFRATDGKPLWSTADQPTLKDFNFAGTPVACGQFVYALAVAGEEGNASRASLALVALDALNGRLRWQATLGTYPAAAAGGEGGKPWDAIAAQSEPLVAEDAVFVSPGSGFVGCVGRLDGRVRWLRPYAAAAEASVRWRGTPVLCGTVLIAAPRDAGSTATALDAATGREIWSTAVDVPTLIGRTATTAIFAGPQGVTAVSARDGRSAWRWDAPRAFKVTGPAVVHDEFVLVQTTSPTICLRADDGTAIVKDAPNPPFFRRLLNVVPVTRAMDEIGAGKSFPVPGGS